MASFTSKFKSTPTFTFKFKSQSITSYNDISKLPAPNQYNPQRKDQKLDPAVKFPKSQRGQHFLKRFSTPGPGNYQTKSSFSLSNKQQSTSLDKKHSKFSLSKRFEDKLQIKPSPAQYKPNQSAILKHMPNCIIPAKTSLNPIQLKVKMNLYKPGVGIYQMNQYTAFSVEKNKMRSIQFPKSARPSQVLNKNLPGPGKYLQQNTWKTQSFYKNTSCKLSKAQRKIDFSHASAKFKSPGPGNYQKISFIQQNSKKARGYTCRVKTSNKQQKSPGPGDYDSSSLLKYKFKSASNMKIGHSKRTSAFNGNSNGSVNLSNLNISKSQDNIKIKPLAAPGPGSYQPNPQNIKFKAQRKFFKFSKEKKYSEVNANFLDKKINKSASLQNLGPGKYYTNFSKLAKEKSSPNFSFSKNIYKITEFDGGQSQKKKGFCHPGPADYSPNQKIVKNHSAQFKIPKQIRAVTLSSSVLQKSQKNIIKSKIGPGTYDKYANQIISQRSVKFNKSPRFTFMDQISKRGISQYNNNGFSGRQEFPNPPKYMNVHSKLKINQKKMTNI